MPPRGRDMHVEIDKRPASTAMWASVAPLHAWRSLDAHCPRLHAGPTPHPGVQLQAARVAHGRGRFEHDRELHAVRVSEATAEPVRSRLLPRLRRGDLRLGRVGVDSGRYPGAEARG